MDLWLRRGRAIAATAAADGAASRCAAGAAEDDHREAHSCEGGNEDTSLWKLILDYLEAHPHDVWHTDERGRTGLHAACTRRAPPSVLHALLQLSRDAEGAGADRERTALLHARDRHGRTALALAVTHGLPINSIRFLLNCGPAAAFVPDHMGYLPLHLVCSGGGSSYSVEDRADLVKWLLQANPRAAGQESFRGETPLHGAVEGRAPLAVVRQLVQASPRAVVMDGPGVNPLFLAIRCNAGADIVRCLVEACPQATTLHQQDTFCLPLRFALECQSPLAVQRLLCTNPDVVLDSDPYVNNTVLHQMLRDGICVRNDTVRLLLRVAPHLANTPSKCGSTPTDLALERFATLRSPNPRTLDRLWRVVSLLLRASNYGPKATELDENDNAVAPVLHAVASRADCPVDVFQYALQKHPDQLHTRDANGALPLHLAIQRPEPAPNTGSRRPVVPVASKNHAILEILRRHPDCADLPATVVRWDGRRTAVTTLNLAARYAMTITSDAVWEAIVQLQPAQLRVRDPIEKLYPFQMAAAAAAASQPESTVKASDRSATEALWLTTVYLLARQTPDLLGASSNSPRLA